MHLMAKRSMDPRLVLAKDFLRLLHKSSFFALLLVFSFSTLTCSGSTYMNVNYFPPLHLEALQALWGAWNESTPDLATNLAGWNSDNRNPCSQDYNVDAHPNWQGVECLDFVSCTQFKWDGTIWTRNCTSLITGLTLDNASIVGFLPEEITYINTLSTLKLTGNPQLTGTLPTYMILLHDLHTLDLHDNDFSGEIPELTRLRNVNLRGNRFRNCSNGVFPFYVMRWKGLAETINLGSNELEGPIPEDAFQNSTQLVQLDLSHNRFNGTPPSFLNVTSLEVLDLSYNNFVGALPNLTTMAALRYVNLSGNAFTGSALGFWNSSELQELYLDDNLISGSLNVSDLDSRGLLSLRSANASGNLRVLSLVNNSISEVIYDVTKIGASTTVISLQGNPYCEAPDADDGTRCFCTQVCKYTYYDAARALARKEAKRKIRNAVIATVVTSVSSLLLLLAGLAAFYHRSKKYRMYCQIELQKKCDEFEVRPTIFHYSQLRTATRDFHPDRKLGQGSFGAVYKGILPNGNVVAVKQLFARTTQSIDEFLNEVVLLTGMKHRNLVNLKGCCIREHERLLVYEYVDNFDIDKILLRSNPDTKKAQLSWPIRLKMCLGVARGLHYLHELAQPRIIHRDIKPSNILLNKNYETKIADFGLAFLFPDEESYILTNHVAGTKGYLAPEYASYGQLSNKVDIFSFGILCLEVVSGRRVVEEKLGSSKMYLPKWAWNLHQQGNLNDFIDPTMYLQHEEMAEVHRLVSIAFLCIQNEAELRPTIEHVVAMLQGEIGFQEMVSTYGIEDQSLESKKLFESSNSSLSIVD